MTVSPLKTVRPLALICSALLVASGCAKKPSSSSDTISCTLGTTWTTLSDYQSSSTHDSQAGGIAADSSGKVFASGYGIDIGGIYHWLTLPISSGTPGQVDDFQVTPGTSSGNFGYGQSVAVDSSGDAYTIGEDNSGHWRVRKSVDGGNSWTLVDDFHANVSDIPEAIAVSGTTVYVVGETVDSGGKGLWQVRKSTNGGQSWTSFTAYQYVSGQTSSAQGVAIDPSGAVYVSGFGYDGGGIPHWLIQKSADGTSWTGVEDYQYMSGHQALGYGIGVDGNGNVYSAGLGNDTFGSHWIVLKSSDGGTTWLPTDNYAYPQGSGVSVAYGFNTDASGNLYAVGTGFDGTSRHWVVRQFDGSSWKTLDDFSYSSGKDSIPYGIVQDSTGNVYVAGGGKDSSGHLHWLIRKLPCS